MSKQSFRILCLGISVVAHFTAYLQFLFIMDKTRLPAEWQGQFYLLLAISFILSVALFMLPQSAYVFWPNLLVRALILILIGLAFGANLTIESILLGTLILETFANSTLFKSSISIIILNAIFVKMHFPIEAWGRRIPSPSTGDLISFAMVALIITLLSALIRFLVDNKALTTEINQKYNDTTLQLVQANFQLQEYATLVERQAKENERKRLAAEMHDTIAYTFTNLLMMLEVAIALSGGDREELKTHLERVRDVTKGSLDEVRNALRALRPVTMKEDSGLSTIYHLVQTFTESTRIKVDLRLGDAPLHFGEEADWAVYRLVQEGITNALRHGSANLIEITFYREGNGVCIRVKDNGCGLKKEYKEGFGLTGMRERIDKLGGKLDYSSEPGKYFLLSAWIPLKEEERYEQN